VSRSLLNKAAVREFILATAPSLRAHEFKQVSSGTVIDAENALKQWLRNRIKATPSRGKTI